MSTENEKSPAVAPSALNAELGLRPIEWLYEIHARNERDKFIPKTCTEAALIERIDNLEKEFEEILQTLLPQYFPPTGGWSHVCKDGETHVTLAYKCPHNCGKMYVPNPKNIETGPT